MKASNPLDSAAAERAPAATTSTAGRRSSAVRDVAQRAALPRWQESPRSAAQRATLGATFGPAVQREAAPDEDELQMKRRTGVLQAQGLEDEEVPVQGRWQTVQRQGMEEDELQMKRAPVASVQRAPEPDARRNDTGLPDGLKSGIESLSGLSMDHVKVHYNSSQPAQLNALAYAQGSDIHLGPGQEQHLPHEAWHVVQQAQGRVQPTMQMREGVPVNDDKGLEHEADVMGARAASSRVPAATEGQTPAETVVQPMREHGGTTFKREPDGQAHRTRASAGPSRTSHGRVVRAAPGATVVQRVLGVGQTVTAADLANVTVNKVDAKVWVLTDPQQGRVVIKIENPVGGETTGQFEGRHDTVTWLAQQALQGVPGAQALTPAELAALAQLNAVEVGKGGPTLASFAAQPQGLVFLKVAHVDMGAHLESRIEAATADMRRGGRRGFERQAGLLQLMSDQATLQSLGRIAAFDLVVNNADRFRPDGTANPKNIDFDAANQPLAIDNLDPNNRLDANAWPGRARVIDRGSRSGYSAKVVLFLLGMVGIDEQGDPNAVLRTIAAFRAGMELGVTTMKGQEAALRARAALAGDAHRTALGQLVADRLRDLDP
jgi:hypothetical protein